MSIYRQFIFENWEFEPAAKTLSLYYAIDDVHTFIETYRFDFDFAQYDQAAFEQACHNLFIMAGVSYYKTYLPSEIIIKKGGLDPNAAAFFSDTYQQGLGEFFYVNKLDPRTPVEFPVNEAAVAQLPSQPAEASGLLVGIGGGKDSLVSVEILRNQPKVATWSLNHKAQLSPLIQQIGLPHFWVERKWDPLLLKHNEQGAYNGHIPISAIFACVGTIVALLSGYRDAIVSNENSANEPTLTYQGLDINHQYSKSLAFEERYQALLQQQFGDTTRYYSFLRPLSELHIAELFATYGFEKYKSAFSSCNRAFVHSSDHMFWCGECPKCAFVFLALTPFVSRVELESLWGGKNLLLDPQLEVIYRQLLGIAGDKPLDCIGEIKESRTAMLLAQKTYPELAKYTFEVPSNYDYRQLSASAMPGDLLELLQSAL